MQRDNYTIRISAAAMVMAVLLRLGISTAPVWQDPHFLSFLVWLQTGRLVQSTVPTETTAPTVPTTFPAETVPTVPDPRPSVLPSAPEPLVLPAVSMSDLGRINVHYSCALRPDMASLLLAPLQWDLTDGAPRVLILHSHATESYTPDGEDTYEPSGDYRTLDTSQNMVSIGAEVARILQEAGIGVIHDTTLHDYPSYNQAYASSRQAVQQYLAEYPSICLVLDLHRDAASTATGQLTTSATVSGAAAAQLMPVVGTNYTGWNANLALALKLTALLEQTDPGVCRPLDLRGQRFNMDLSPAALLIEVGAAGDTRQKALQAAGALARAICAMARGVTTEMSTSAG